MVWGFQVSFHTYKWAETEVFLSTITSTQLDWICMDLRWTSDLTKLMVSAETCSLHKPTHHSNLHEWSSHGNPLGASQTPSIGPWSILNMDMEGKPVEW